MGGKLLNYIIIIVVVIIVGIAVFFVLPNLLHDDGGSSNSTVIDDTIAPSLSVNQEVNESEGSVNVIADSSDSEVEIEKITIVSVENSEDIDEQEGNSATFNILENGKYKVTAYAINGRTATKNITVSNVPIKKKSVPYIPEGFKAIGENIDSDKGFAIVDEVGNQYVWVPVETGKLIRTTLYETDKYEDDGSDLYNSVTKYYGFYVSRFEASRYEIDGEEIASSMNGKTPWTEVTYVDALNASKAVAEKLNYEDCSTNLMNSYAWDTMLEWIDKDEDTKDFSQSTSYGNYGDTIFATGMTDTDKVKNICDLAGNVKEWTTETELKSSKKDNRSKDKLAVISKVVRSGSVGLPNTPSSRKGWPEDTSNIAWGFRFILYKN